MDDLIEKFEKRCKDVGVKPVLATSRAGISESTWYRWKARVVSPNLRTLSAVNAALDAIVVERNRAA